VFINPEMMLASITQEGPAQLRRIVLPPANLAWQFITPQRKSVAFNWGRPNTIRDGQEIRLRLYWTAVTKDTAVRASWQVQWRWVTALRPGDPPTLPQTSITNIVNATPGAQTVTAPQAQEMQLNVTNPYRLVPGVDNKTGDYLQVQIMMETFQGEQADVNEIFLLLAQLDWGGDVA
jgi:hypothetical protein